MSDTGGMGVTDRLSEGTGEGTGAFALPARWRLPLLVLFLLACFLPGLFALPVVDRDEARFAQASRQMLASGDYVVPRLGAETRFKKPIGIYWLQSAAARALGFRGEAPIWALRIPSLIGALLAALGTYVIGRRLFGDEAGLIAAALLGASLILNGEARLAKTDAMQLACAIGVQMVLARAYLARAPLALGEILLFWAALGLAILIKGPIVPLLAGLTALALVIADRRASWLKRLRPALGLPVTALMVLPWLIAIYLQAGTDFFHEAVGNDLLGKVATGQESHGAPPGAHLAAFLVAFWPGAALAILALPWVWRARREPAVRFCLAWGLPFWIVFELIATKLPHYTLPAYPAIALLTGAALWASRDAPAPLWGRLLTATSAAGGMAGAVAVPALLYGLEGRIDPLVLALALSVVAIGALALGRALKAGPLAALPVLLAQAAASYGLAFGLVLPQIETAFISPRLAAATHLLPCAAPQVMVAGFGEASVLFHLGAETRLGNGAQAADFLKDTQGCRAVFVGANQQAGFKARAAELGLTPVALTTVDGLNLATTRRLSLTLYAPPAPQP